MADISQELDRIAEQFAVKVGLAKGEVVNALMDLVKGKTAEESLEILAGVNIQAAMEMKLVGAFSMYEAGVVSMLKNTYTTIAIPESVLRTILDLTKASISSEVTGRLSKVSLQSIIDGIATGKSPSEVIAAIDEIMPRVDTLVNTAFSQFSNTTKNIMAEKLPPDTKFVYIGAYDSKTRDRCVEKIGFSPATRAEIIGRFGDMNNEIWNCRHGWEQRSSSPKDQGFEEVKFVDA